jgi:hypothetical protein
MAELLFDNGRVQIETDCGCAIWLDEGEALLVASLITERLTPPASAQRITYERGYGPGDGDSRVIETWDGYNAGSSAPEPDIES